MSAQFTQLGPFFDQGVICGAAKLEHYEAGTSTLKNIYSDAAMTVNLPQPFVSDANGVFNFYADGYYKLIFKKSDGAVLHTIDNWKIIDQSQQNLSSGIPIATGSNMTLGDATWAHWTGSTNVQTLTGSALFYWAMADGSFTLVHSASLIMPDSRNRKVNSGDVIFFINEGAGVYRLGGHMEKEGGWSGRQAAPAAATAALDVPTDGDFIQVSGTTSVTSVGVASAGYRFMAMFTGAGLNITDNGTTMRGPWGRAYRTVPNEVIEFVSLGSGSWVYWSRNGPKERVGVSLEWNSTTLPSGYLWENGQAVSRTDYPGLFAEIGTVFGIGDGSTTFHLPDCQGRTVITVDGGANRVTSASTGGANADTMGGTGGAQTHTLALSETPAHTHDVAGVGTNTAGPVFAGGADKATSTVTTTSQGGGGAHNNMPPWIAKQKIIRF